MQLHCIASDWTAKAFAICLCGDWRPCCCSYWPSATPEGVQGGVRHSVLQGIWWDRSLDSWMFLGTNFTLLVLASPHIERSTNFLHGDIRPSWLTKNLLQIECFMALNSPFTKTLYIDFLPLPLWSSLFRAIWDAASRAAVCILPQIKLSTLKLYIFFF